MTMAMNNGVCSTPPLARRVTVILRRDQIDTVHIHTVIILRWFKRSKGVLD